MLLVGAAVLLFLFLNGNSITAASRITLSDGTVFNFNLLTDQYGEDNVSRLTSLFNAMQGFDLSRLQVQLMLSQALHETGLFTDSANYYNMDALHNFAGIMGNSRYPSGAVSPYAQYPSLKDFVGDWITVLSFGQQPINAYDVTGFCQRLKNNGYFTDNLSTYTNAVQAWYNLLSGINQ